MATQLYYPFNYTDGYNLVATSGSAYLEIVHIVFQCTEDATITFQAESTIDETVTILSGDMLFPAKTGFNLTPPVSAYSPQVLFQLEPNENFIMYVSSLGTVNGLIYWQIAI